MTKYKAFIASSLDGFIARADGSIDWLTSQEYTLEKNDFGYSSFMAGIDCIIMGRTTFETVLSFETYPFVSIPVYVLTRNSSYKFESDYQIEIFHGNLCELNSKLETQQIKVAYVDGGQLIQSFINESLLNELTITQIPILLGSGLPLYGNLTKETKLKHIQTQSFLNGFVQSTYQIS
ncbi:dihydrofolate reductase [Leptospira congkakensis]|uniref:Dihydrofolate reductase n=1 Tax=Leptospira congkakensis TaxID=2484932 RepID=A0A4Z1ANE6_9LEPT|nr:dihydrofolate reductase family protein [Leptospira congkakensis]TGL85276.1 dihydrofolate reductase [Leptospira congkakensis]TGL85373.1 dihydrofolate reductase [Leptospira congkakensis]TGL99883.1 dihydrofolate reductase [Leptospira congkakensis]